MMTIKNADIRAIMRRRAKPELLGQIDESKYLYCRCRCPVDTRYGIKIPVDDLHGWEKEYGECYVHCDNCGSEIVICFPARTEKKALLGRRANIVQPDDLLRQNTFKNESEE